MSSSYYCCLNCDEVTFHAVLDADEKCPYCGGDTRYAYTTSGAWEDPFHEQREWEEEHGYGGY